MKPGLALTLPVFLVTGCSLAPEPAPPTPVETLPEAYAEADSAAYGPTGWWRSYGDPGLVTLVDSVLAENLDLAEAVARVLEARAQVGIATADLLPGLTGTANATQTSNPNNAGFGLQIFELLRGAAGDTTGGGGGGGESEAEGPPDRFTNTTYDMALALSYEVDFWGRARNDRGAAVQELEATGADLQAALLGVIAETITGYFEVADLRRRIALTEEIVAVLEEREALTRSRYDRGLVTSFELYQVRQDLRNAQAGLPELRSLRNEAEGRLAILAGRYPDQMSGLLDRTSLPGSSLPPIPASVPADLLWQRPDVRAAGMRLEAARLRVGARRAELLPRLSLTGTLGLQSADASQWLDVSQWFRNLTAGLTAPLFQGGRLRANVRVAEAQMAQLHAAYGRAVLTAVVEAENALARLREEEARLSFFTSQLEEAESSVNLQARRYRSGVGGYADYLDALRNRLTVATTLAQASRDYALARLGVHRALGGDWVLPEDATPEALQPDGGS